MASTEECKEELAQLWWLAKKLTGDDETHTKDWKRVSKRKTLGGMDGAIRVFEYTPTGDQFVFLTTDEDDDLDEYEVFHTGDWLFHIGAIDQTVTLCFNPEGYWRDEQCLYDQHTAGIIRALFGLDLETMGADELSENSYLVRPEDREFLEKTLIASGLKTDPEFSAFMQKYEQS